MSPPSNDTLLIDGPTPGNPFGFKLTPATSSTEDSQIYGEEVIQWLIYVKVSVYVWCECTYNNTHTYYICTYMWCVVGTDLSANIYAICTHPILGIA